MLIKYLGFLAFVFQVADSCIPMLPPQPTEAPTEESPPAAETSTIPANISSVTTKKPEDCVTVEINPGRPCVFPFTYQYHQHYECLPSQDKYWCALTPVYNKEEWGYCKQSLCPPTSEEPTKMPTEEAPTTPTPLNWEAGSTTAELMSNLKGYRCNINFEFALQKGVKFREITGVCQAESSSDQNAEDRIQKLGIQKFRLETVAGIKLSCEIGAAFLDNSQTLSEEVLNSSLKCEAVEDGCITVEGEVYPAQCIFPFIYEGRRYQACTDRPGSSKLWCPTKIDETEEAVEWGYCSRRCGYCGGSPVTTRGGQTCGFDCLIGAERNMVGYEKVPLLKPSIAVTQPTESNYKGEKGGHHQLNIGPQSITISCPETKFYDPAFQGADSVSVSCGPDKHRLTAVTQSGTTLTGIKNDQFGCDPCPNIFQSPQGTTVSYSSQGYQLHVKTIADCATYCIESYSCSGFIYSKYEEQCQLIQHFTSASETFKMKTGHIMCVNRIPSPPPPQLCVECSACKLKQQKNTRVHAGQNKWAEYHGISILKMLQSLQVIPGPLKILRISDNPKYWEEARQELLTSHNEQNGVYMYFIGPANANPNINHVNFHAAPYNAISADKDFIPFYIGHTHDVADRYYQHIITTEKKPAKLWLKWLAFRHILRNVLTGQMPNSILYYTQAIVPDRTDSQILEALFLDAFDFLRNKLDNVCRRGENGADLTDFDVFPNPNPYGTLSSGTLMKTAVNKALVDNANKFLPAIYAAPPAPIAHLP